MRPNPPRVHLGLNLPSKLRLLSALICGALLALLLYSWDDLAGAQQPGGPDQDPSVSGRPLNAAPGVDYVGSQMCRGCHPDVYENFRKTPMGHSMGFPAEYPRHGEDFQNFKILNKELNRYFEFYRQDSEFFQSEYELDPEDGSEVFRHTEKIDYIIGAGEQGYTYVVRRGDFLFEAPLSFYTSLGTWSFSPGYDFVDIGFSRPITGECIVCHSGKPQVIPKREGLFKDPPFLEMAIGCENCHGPGQLHVAARVEGTPVSGGVDRTIVNPAKLPGGLADNICMSCHQMGDARVLMPGKFFLDFRPGTPLTETLAIFKIPLNRDSPSNLLEHNFAMKLSRCYQETGGSLSCLTCHNPHLRPSPEERPAHYRNKCLTCHQQESCTVPHETRLQQNPPDDCAGCHMPKSSERAIPHSSLTNHRIPRRPEEPIPDSAFHLTTSRLPDLIHLNPSPDGTNKSLPLLTVFQAYGKISPSHPEYKPRHMALMNQLAKTNRDNIAVLTALARTASEKNSPEEIAVAIEHLERAIQLGSASPQVHQLLAKLLIQTGRGPEAVTVLKHGLGLSPYNRDLYKDLAMYFLTEDKIPEALEIIEEALRVAPEDSYMRMLSILASMSDSN